MPKVSVVIPLYNKAPYIERALRSVLAQIFQDFEIIVIDDGSTDDGAQIVKSISDKRIRLVQQKNAGVSAARNKGIELANADLIAFLDADDAWKPEFLETILRLRKKFPEAGAYATAYEEVFTGGKIIVPKFKAIPSPPWEGIIPRYFHSTLGPPPVNASAIAVPKSIFKKIGNFPVGEPLGEDLDMWGWIALKYPIAFSWHIGSTYFMDANNRASNANLYVTEKDSPFVITALQAIDKGNVPLAILTDLEEYIAKRQLSRASKILLIGHRPEISRKMIIRSRPKTIGNCQKKYWLYFWTFLPIIITRLTWWLKKMLGKF